MRIIIICPKCGKANSIENISCTGKFRSGKDKGKPCTVRNLKKNPNKKPGQKKKETQLNNIAFCQDSLLLDLVATRLGDYCQS